MFVTLFLLSLVQYRGKVAEGAFLISGSPGPDWTELRLHSSCSIPSCIYFKPILEFIIFGCFIGKFGAEFDSPVLKRL